MDKRNVRIESLMEFLVIIALVAVFLYFYIKILFY